MDTVNGETQERGAYLVGARMTDLTPPPEWPCDAPRGLQSDFWQETDTGKPSHPLHRVLISLECHSITPGSRTLPHKRRFGPVKVALLRGDLLPVRRRFIHQLIEVLPLLSVVLDGLGQAMTQIVAIEGQV